MTVAADVTINLAAMPTDDATAQIPVPTAVVVYWRPGCGFCQALMWELGRMGITFEQRNIWEDDSAAAFVRSVARGHETVPTVAVGPAVMVNPEATSVLAALREHAPEQVPTKLIARPSRVSQTLRRVLSDDTAPAQDQDQGR
jgi:DNA-binding transcriptional LysR family regulator